MQKFGFLTMTRLRILNRAALICNVFFLLAIVLLTIKRPVNPGLFSVTIVLGFVVAVFLNIIVNAWMIILKLNKKPLTEIPNYLIYVNGAFLIVQLILLVK